MSFKNLVKDENINENKITKLSDAIDNLIEKFELEDGKQLSFGTVLGQLVENYGLKNRTEKECIGLLNEMIDEWIAQDYIKGEY